jgi:DNA-binding CsgD family transcriptional regulator
VLGVVRAAILSGFWDTAAERVEQARRLADEAGDEKLGVRTTGLAAHVALGRALHSAGPGDANLRELRWFRHHGRRLVAEAAIRDGWGDPAPWLREALEFFTALHAGRVVSACRTLLRRAGAPVPRRRAAGVEIPEPLRALGVTGREMVVLTLVAEGLTNAQIGKRLFLSPRTIERHVGSLLARTGARSRTDLAALATSHAQRA